MKEVNAQVLVTYIDNKKFAECNDSGLISRLIWAWNDISLADNFFGKIKDGKFPLPFALQRGAQMYFIRLAISHLHEAFKVVRDIRENERMQDLLEKCSPIAKKFYKKLIDCIEGDTKSDFDRYISKLRGNVGFHYQESQKLISRALKGIISGSDEDPSEITLSADVRLCRFCTGDRLHDKITCRQIWEIPNDANVKDEANRIVGFASSLTEAFLRFAGELIAWYFYENSLFLDGYDTNEIRIILENMRAYDK